MSEQQHRSLARWLVDQRQAADPLVIGINGAQGTGKSTLALRLKELLAEQYALRSVILSLDDLYLGHMQRARLADRVHPLLRTRGVPGTHDVALGVQVLEALRGLGAARIPKFIKAIDDRAPESARTAVEGPVDVILFEGWCVGTPPQEETELREPVNELEAREDADGVWRRHVNVQLAMVYPRLFARIDRMIFLRAPDFESIYRWRLEQELKNAEAVSAIPIPASGERGFVDGSSRLMRPEDLRKFIQHYERLTRHALKLMPARADVVIELGPGHEMLEMRFR